MCGLAPEEMVGRLFTDFVPAERYEQDLANFLETMRTGNPVMDYTTVMHHADGRLLTVRANARLVRDAGGCIVGSMGTAWDVARAALFLASEEAAYITGVCLAVDGGLTCRAA